MGQSYTALPHATRANTASNGGPRKRITFELMVPSHIGPVFGTNHRGVRSLRDALGKFFTDPILINSLLRAVYWVF